MKTAKLNEKLWHGIRATLLGALLLATRHATAQISLSWVGSGTNRTIQWPFTTNGYILETSPVLGPSAQWTPAPIVTSVLQSNSSPASTIISTPSMTMDAPSAFYRLHAAPVPQLGSATQIIAQPASVVAAEGATNVTFSVITGSPTGVSYQWLQDDGLGVFFPMSAQTNSQLVLPVAGAFDDGARFECMIIGGGQVVGFSDVATLKVVPAAGRTAIAWGTGTTTTYSNVTEIATGDLDNVVRADNGAVTGYGDNSSGETNIPPQAQGAFALAAGYLHNLALTSNGTVVAWGDNTYGQATVPPGLSNIVRIAAGPYYSLALGSHGEISGWGYNAYGQLTAPSGLHNVLELAAGGWHVLALQADGTVMAWGADTYGQIDLPPGLTGVRAVAAGMGHSLALQDDGTVVAWGDNSAGQCDVPAALHNVVAIAAGDEFSVALRADGTVVTWGDDTYGEKDVPAGVANSTAIAAGGSYAVAMTTPLADLATTLTLNTIRSISYSNQVTITFSGPVGAFSATNFTFINANTNSPAITVQSATQTGSNSVTLVLSSPLPAGSTNSLVVTGLTDPNGNAMTPAVVTVTAFTPETPCAGGELLVKHAYSECNADGFWHVVEDDYYACPPNGAVTKFRVSDDATTQPCGAGQNPPSPVGLTYPTAAQAGATCQSPVKLGEIQVCEVVGGLWSLSTYIKYQCADGSIYYSGPTQNVTMNPPTSGNQPPPGP